MKQFCSLSKGWYYAWKVSSDCFFLLWTVDTFSFPSARLVCVWEQRHVNKRRRRSHWKGLCSRWADWCEKDLGVEVRGPEWGRRGIGGLSAWQTAGQTLRIWHVGGPSLSTWEVVLTEKMLINRRMEVRIHSKQAGLRTISFWTMKLNIFVKIKVFLGICTPSTLGWVVWTCCLVSCAGCQFGPGTSWSCPERCVN